MVKLSGCVPDLAGGEARKEFSTRLHLTVCHLEPGDAARDWRDRYCRYLQLDWGQLGRGAMRAAMESRDCCARESWSMRL